MLARHIQWGNAIDVFALDPQDLAARCNNGRGRTQTQDRFRQSGHRVELAASRVAAYGIQGVASLLNDRIGLLWHGRRTALPRHQTLSATLDWSYDLLPELQQDTLRRLGVFVGFFTLEAARAIVVGEGIDEEQVVEAIGDLVAKSLVAPAIDTAPAR